MSTPEPNWRTSSYTNANGGECVEVAETPEVVKVRDTKHRGLGYLEFDPRVWAVFVAEVKRGRL